MWNAKRPMENNNMQKCILKEAAEQNVSKTNYNL